MIDLIAMSAPTLLALAGQPALPVLLCAAVTGVLSMWLYKITSPQARLAEVVSQLKETQRQVAAYDGEFDGAWPLIRESLRLSFVRLGMVIGPTLAAGIPVIAAMLWIDMTFPDARVLPFGPLWLRSAEAAFLVVVSLSALTVKAVFRIA
ncbi:hypothetical protein Mal4_58580 [Maioricimonas rarisocia]|uniref:Uncharacterized protein n=1 Tax=Maioricimonas rarisocia TaxID=2528026 RepID=A0A517ZG89_9PLAN|nr:hypothetical protein [Maioricimonas rarisocia]QDU41490.1 hypothetical protein Mal4_58580 [Maioricimonas rarisocia]